MIELSSSSYYYKPRVPREKREEDDAQIRDLVEQVQSVFPKAGYRMVKDHLQRSGIKIGERKLRRVMGKFGLWAEVKRAYVNTTDSSHDYELYPILVRGMRLTGTNQVWAADITYSTPRPSRLQKARMRARDMNGMRSR